MRCDFDLKARDGLIIHCSRWEIPGGVKARGAVQIIHGSLENSLRWAHVAEALNEPNRKQVPADLTAWMGA